MIGDCDDDNDQARAQALRLLGRDYSDFEVCRGYLQQGRENLSLALDLADAAMTEEARGQVQRCMTILNGLCTQPPRLDYQAEG